MAIRAAIYTRVSSVTQEREGTSLTTQLLSCRARAAEMGYTVVAEFEEVFSGEYLFERPKLYSLLNMVEAKELDVILVHALDRLSRDPAHQGYIKSIADKSSVRVESVTERLDNSFEGELMRTIGGLAAKWENMKRAERARRGMKARVDAGKLPGTSLPLGYRWIDPEPGRKTKVEIDPEKAPIVRRLFEYVGNGGTASALADILNDEGIPTAKPRAGGLNRWTMRTIGRIIRNDAYIGKAWGNKTLSTREGGKRHVIEERAHTGSVALQDGIFPTLIEPELWERANRQLTRNRKEAKRNSRHADLFLLRGGFAKCFYCGGTIEANLMPKGERYYRCIPKQRKIHGCPNCSIRADELEDAVWSSVRRILRDPISIEQHLQHQAESDTTKNHLESLESALSACSQEIVSVSDAIAMTNHPAARQALAMKLDELAGRQAKLDAERRKLLEVRTARERSKAVLRNLSNSFERRYAEIDSMTLAQKRDILAEFGVVVTVYPKGSPNRWVIDMAWEPTMEEIMLEWPDEEPVLVLSRAENGIAGQHAKASISRCRSARA